MVSFQGSKNIYLKQNLKLRRKVNKAYLENIQVFKYELLSKAHNFVRMEAHRLNIL